MAYLTYSNDYTTIQKDVEMDSALCGLQPIRGGGESPQHEELLLLEPRVKTKKPPFYKVVMLNDDYTPMDFVVEVLKSIFRQSHEDAINTMLQIHHHGSGQCGVFTRDVAETKIDMVIACAKRQEYPLQCVMETE